MSSETVCKLVEEARLVPVIRAPSEDLAFAAVEALADGGITVFEVTLTVPGAVRVLRELVRRHANIPNSKVVVGAGTVVTVEDAQACIEAGTQFIVSPNLNLEVVALAKKHDVAIMPGALTPTEVVTAWQAGSDMVKIFPCSAMGGASYVKALKAPLPHVKLLPTGGVNLDTAASFLKAGASALGVGANLVDIGALQKEGAQSLVEKARAYVAAVQD